MLYGMNILQLHPIFSKFQSHFSATNQLLVIWLVAGREAVAKELAIPGIHGYNLVNVLTEGKFEAPICIACLSKWKYKISCLSYDITWICLVFRVFLGDN